MSPRTRTSRRPAHRIRTRGPAVAAALVVAGALAAACSMSGEPGAFPDRVTLPTLDAPVPLPVERCGDYFVVTAVINGEEGVPLLLDTGAGSTHLDPEVMDRLDLAGGIDSLRIGGFTAYDFGAHALDMTQLSAALGREIQGILGQPVFAGVSVTWDFPRGTLEVSTDTLAASEPGVVPTRRDRRPFVGAVVGSDTLWVLIDTGSSRGLTLRDPERFALHGPLETTGARVRMDGVYLVHSARIDGEARVGPLRLPDPVVDNSVSVNLVGQEFLRPFRITFDPRTRRVRFQRDDAPVDAPLASGPVGAEGFALVPHPEFARVGWVDSTATAAGLREDDRVVEVDGVPWARRGCRAPGPELLQDSVRLGIERDGERLEVVVPVRAAHGMPARDPEGSSLVP